MIFSIKKTQFTCLLALTLSCSKNSTLNSKLQYGYMTPDNPVLFDIAWNEKLVLCGSPPHNMIDLAKQAVQDWASNAMRSDLQIEILKSCQNAKNAAASIELIYGDPVQCDGSIAGYHKQDGSDHVIVACPNAMNFQRDNSGGLQDDNILSLLRHEVGHAFGLCDQYNPDLIGTGKSTIGFNPQNCDDKKFRSSTAKRSVMGSNYEASPIRLTPDDILGIRLGACKDSRFNGQRTRSVNKEWLVRNENELRNWRADEAFQNELSRLIKRGVPILEECVAG